MKPTPVLGTQRLIGPPEEATLFLGTSHIQAIGVLGGMALLQRGGFTAKALQTTPHVQHFWMRLTIHRFHILQGLILPTKQQTRLDGTFHILPSLLRFSCLQTHVMARAYHGVHRLSFTVFRLSIVLRIVIHGRQCELRRWRRCRLLHHVIQFFHHVFHGRSGVFHHLAHHRITVLGCPRLKGSSFSSSPEGWVDFLFRSGQRTGDTSTDIVLKVVFTPYHLRLFIPSTLLSHWSAYSSI